MADGGPFAIDFGAKEERERQEKLDKEAKDKEENNDGKNGEGETDDKKKPPKVKIDWDGAVVDDNWYTREVKIFDYNITYAQITAGFLSFVIIVVIISIITMICIYKHREKVKVGIQRLSTSIRASLSRKSMQQI